MARASKSFATASRATHALTLLLCLFWAGPQFARADAAEPEQASSTTQTAKPAAGDNSGASAADASRKKTDEGADSAAAADATATGDPEKKSAAEQADEQAERENLERPIEDPETRALLVRAEEHYYRKRHHIALKLFQLVIEREPEHALAYRYAGDIYLKRSELDLAEEHLHIARELSAHPEQEWFRLGQVAYLRADAAAARKAFERALEIKPDFVICRFYLGFVSYRLQRDKERTIEHWESYRRLAPDDPQGPEIDRAIEILRNPDYEIPNFDEGEKPTLPESADGADTRVPYQPGRDESEKSKNTGEELINIDDL
ncbi:MAG: tetratricopeptide repeat protein [bacterium]|nr:tetratricopeptide repeat protein [bacterium]